MSYTVVTPGAKSRPATVTAASALLYLCAAIQLASAVVSLLSLGPIQKVLDEEFAGTPEANAVGTASTIVIIIAGSFSALLAIGTVVLAALIGKGKNPARIVTWVLAGIGVLCNGCGLAGTALSNSLSGLGGTPTAESQEIERRLNEAVPAWQNAVGTAASIIVLLALVAVIILLALPASNAFFRKEQEVWVPPTWPGEGGGGYPAAPTGGGTPVPPPLG